MAGLVTGGLLLLGCSSSPTPSIEGTYRLARFRGKDLPAKDFQLPDRRTGQPTECWYTAARGDLDLAAGTFRYTVTYENSCTNEVMWVGTVHGRYDHVGNELTFRAPGENEGLVYPGSVADGSITVREPSNVLVFIR
jgi:hypothetical protein